MSDTTSFLDKIPSFFFAGADNKNVPQALRQRIALAMLMQKKAYPKTFGEGLSAIGDSIGDIGVMRRMEREAAEAEVAGKTSREEVTGGGVVPPTTVQRTSYAPTEDVPQETELTPPIAGAQVAPRPVVTPPPQPSVLPPAAPAAPLPPDQQQSYEPGAPVRLSNPDAVQDWRNQNPLPSNLPPVPGAAPGARRWPTPGPIAAPQAWPPAEPPPAAPAAPAAPLPPQPAAQNFNDRFSPAGTGRRSAIEPPAGTPVMAFGGEPSENIPPPANPRDLAAAALVAQQTAQAVPPVNPTITAGGGPPANAFTQDQGIKPAPRVAAPPPAAQPAAQPGYVLEVPPEPKPPGRVPMHPIEQRIIDKINNTPAAYRDSVREALQTTLQQAQDLRARQQQEADAIYKDKMTQRHELIKLQEQQRADQATRITTYDKGASEADVAREKARIVGRTGMEPEQLYKRLDDDKASVDQTMKAQSAQQLARKAIRDGVITGYGANMRIASAKFADWAFKNGMSGNMAANTETMQAALSAGLSEAVKTVNGEGGAGVSNADVKIAQGIAGSDPALQMKTIQSIMDRAAEINHRKIDSYENKIDHYLAGEKAELRYKTGGSTVPPDKLKILLDDPTQMKSKFDEVYGPGAADLEIARFKRAQRRQGKD